MPNLEGEGMSRAAPAPLGFSIEKQKIELDLDFAACSAKGKTIITISPQTQDLKFLRLDARNLNISKLTVENKQVTVKYQDPYQKVGPTHGMGVHQHHFLKQSMDQALALADETGLLITLPKNFQIKVMDGFTALATHNMDLSSAATDPSKRRSTDGAETPAPKTAADDIGSYFAPFTVYIEYEIRNPRDGLYFAGIQEDDSRYPQAYTRSSVVPGTACCWFPCLDNLGSRSSFEFHITAPRLLGDVFPELARPLANGVSADGVSNGKDVSMSGTEDSRFARLTAAERGVEMSVIGSGNLEDEIVNPKDLSRKTTSFKCDTPVTARHIGFAVGPFEHVNLSEFREDDEDEMLGASAVPIHGFCLPGRSEEATNICMPLANAVDHFTTDYGSYAFTNYKLVFVDDLSVDVADMASLSICSNRLLFPPEVIDPIDSVTRTIVHAAAAQWLGVDIIPREFEDLWVVIGLSYFITDRFLEDLCGRNEIRFRQRMANERLFSLDVNRPSLHQLGTILDLDPSELEFMKLKAPLVLWILHNRIKKGNPLTGVHRIVWRTMVNSTTDQLPNNALSTAEFVRVCEKFVHQKMDPFFNQWVYGAGCPHFWVHQKWNKKKTCIDMTISQVQGTQQAIKAGQDRNMDPREFHREIKEEKNAVYAGAIQPLFTGGLTIRVHEADGTPYEHAMQVMEQNHKLEVQYHTKYKRLKKTRRQKERAAQQAAAGVVAGEDKDEKVLYCLGDVLKSDEEVNDWRLADWSLEDETAMNDQSFEWIRFDSDFEWLGKVEINQPIYMWASQLQQDRDVTAQVEALQWMANAPKQPVMATICVKTLMDSRYFYGIRAMACDILAMLATEQLDWLGLFHLEKAFQELYCIAGSTAPRVNDFSDRAAYIIQCSIPKAMAKIRDRSGNCPMRVKKFLLEKLKLNDNAENDFSDVHYVSNLLSCLAHSLTSTADRPQQTQNFNFDDDDDEIEADTAELEFVRTAVTELDRYRRMDEWMPTWRNTYTVTTLECFRLLMEKKVIPQHLSEFMQYTRMDNSEDVRLKALQCLIDRGCLRKPDFMRFLLHNYSSEGSPYFRRCVWQLVGEGFGRIGMGLDKPTSADKPAGGLIIEQESSTDKRAEELARMKTIEAALAALKKELGGMESLEVSMSECLASPHITLQEFRSLIEMCSILYDPVDQLRVRLRYPRYWTIRKIGQGESFHGQVEFSQTSHVRTKPMPKVNLPAPPPMGPPPKPAAPKRKASSAFPDDGHAGPPSRKPTASMSKKASPSRIVHLHVPNKRVKLKELADRDASSARPPPPTAPPVQAPSSTPKPFNPFKNRKSSGSASPKPSLNGSGPKLNGGHATPSQSPPATGEQKLKLKLKIKPPTPR